MARNLVGSELAYQRLVADKLACKPQEWLLEVVVGLGGDVVVLEVLLAVESDGLGLDLALLHIDLVAGKNDWDVLANADKITVPVGYVLVGDTRGDVKHDDTALAVDVVSIAQTTKLLLTGGIPDIELDLAEVLCFCQLPPSSASLCVRDVLTVVKPRGWTSTPSVAMYFFSNSPVKWRLTKVVYQRVVSWNSPLPPRIRIRKLR
jgi:hypothetical protein